jgi:hypothetical protein
MIRHHLGRLLALALLASLAAAASAPATASASSCAPNFGACPVNECEWGDNGHNPPTDCHVVGHRTARLGHVGWTYLNLNGCRLGRMCAAVFNDSTSAWRWTGAAWSRASISQGWVYVYPYTGEWRWAWTQRSGWVAMNTGRFELRPF